MRGRVWCPITIRMLLYALTTLISAFLLFQVEPVIAKIILPWFGGSAAVWTACLLFFQLALLFGYLYAHALVRYLRPRTQVMVHCGLLAVSLLALPIYPRNALKPVGAGDPTLGILGVLALTVGLPYFLLSSTGPLLQAWYTRRFYGSMPYWLYALSNAGSMLALVTYPVLFEPEFTNHQQAGMWSIGFAAFVVLCAGTAFLSRGGKDIKLTTDEEAGEKPQPRDYALWMALPAVASVLLLAVTARITANVAAIPFLWILPLSIYLLSFILCFAGGRWYWRIVYLPLLMAALIYLANSLSYTLVGTFDLQLFRLTISIKAIVVVLALYGLALFICCMVCHGELVRLKPHPKYLTHFYLMLSAGGALGGILVGVIAPRVFPTFYEFPLGLVACAALVFVVLFHDPTITWFRGLSGIFTMAAVALTGVLAIYSMKEAGAGAQNASLRVRNFYAALRVDNSGPESDPNAVRSLVNGTILHGSQFLSRINRDLPTTYYGHTTGIGILMASKQKNHETMRVGLIGLGTGTLAAYGREGDYFRFYEINPLVVRLATTEFSYLNDCRCRHEVALGDARLSLERELATSGPQNFDVLVVDAFSGDAIPVHLLTREAMELYFKHLKPDGILAIHISNRYIDLYPVVTTEVQASGRIGRFVRNEGVPEFQTSTSEWTLVTATQPGFDEDILVQSVPLDAPQKIRLWTDDFSNLYTIVK